MKKMKVILAAAVAMLSCCSYTVKAQEYCGRLEYVITDSKAVITGYIGNPQVLNIPAYIEGKRVTEIRENSFYKCDSLEEITIPESVSFIGRHAFYGCGALSRVNLPDNIYSIGEGCFWGCTALKEIDFPDNLKVIEDKAFCNCLSLEQLELPENLQEIGDFTFVSCLKLSEISFNERLEKIGEYSFYNCPLAEKIYIPENITDIGNCAIGYGGKEIALNCNVEIHAPDKSEGRRYALKNSITYINPEESERKHVPLFVPVAITAVSGGLLIAVKLLNNMKSIRGLFRKKCITSE